MGSGYTVCFECKKKGTIHIVEKRNINVVFQIAMFPEWKIWFQKFRYQLKAYKMFRKTPKSLFYFSDQIAPFDMMCQIYYAFPRDVWWVNWIIPTICFDWSQQKRQDLNYSKIIFDMVGSSAMFPLQGMIWGQTGLPGDTSWLQQKWSGERLKWSEIISVSGSIIFSHGMFDV